MQRILLHGYLSHMLGQLDEEVPLPGQCGLEHSAMLHYFAGRMHCKDHESIGPMTGRCQQIILIRCIRRTYLHLLTLQRRLFHNLFDKSIYSGYYMQIQKKEDLHVATISSARIPVFCT